ncbi:CHAT domain-containing tetratricopeptide repeat protein [Dactylosporangium sp. NPDC049525]|uniref:CHAT domain-containing protein n=1 Tax=Dactylosporangium sp. NPDC049525 TaxID=3154730 RepID=UPI00342319A7
MSSTADELAQRLLPIVMADPGKAKALADVALRDARRSGDHAAQAVALRTLGLAARARHDAADAARHLRASIAVARRHRLTQYEAEARMSHALILDDLGRPTAALREIDRAMADLQGQRRTRATMQRALILRRLGFDREAMDLYRGALRAFRQSGDEVWEARTLTNRGVLHGFRGNLRLAEADLRAAQALYNRLGMATAAAQVEHNLGFVAAQAGDVPTALARYDRAHDRLWNTGVDAVSLLDRADLLLSVRLLPEADTAIRAAIAACTDGHLDSVLGQAHLMMARLSAAQSKAAESRAAAAAARKVFARQKRGVWIARARVAELAAVVASGRAHRGTLRDLRTAGRALVAAGWPQPGWEALLDAAQLAVDLGECATAAELLAETAAAWKLGPAPLRVRWSHVRARLELACGATAEAARAATAGLRVADEYRASLGATELRVRGSVEAAALAGLRLRLALDHGGPREALTWAQRCRSAALSLPPTHPSSDPVVARHLSELRRITGELAAAPAGPQRAGRLLRRQRSLEAEIRRRSWRVPGSAPTARTDVPFVDLVAALDGRVLLELLAIDGVLHALVVSRTRTRYRVTHRVVGPIAPVATELEHLRIALSGQILGQGGTSADRAARGVDALDRLLLDPVADLIGTGSMVLVPTGALHAMPWTMLPRLRGRSMTVAPSAAIWWRVATQPPVDGPTVLVGAPSAPQAGAEVAQIAADQSRAGRAGATVLAGERARVAPTLAALDGAAIGHIASHGEFRVDNPLFSFLMLADGPLTVYDLSVLRRPPALLVLSGCDTGLAEVHPGDELMGLVSALLNMGTATVVASTGPVDDGATRVLMRDLYTHLGAGHPPATALAMAQSTARATAQALADPALRASTDSFVCFGAG